MRPGRGPVKSTGAGALHTLEHRLIRGAVARVRASERPWPWRLRPVKRSSPHVRRIQWQPNRRPPDDRLLASPCPPLALDGSLAARPPNIGQLCAAAPLMLHPLSRAAAANVPANLDTSAGPTVATPARLGSPRAWTRPATTTRLTTSSRPAADNPIHLAQLGIRLIVSLRFRLRIPAR